MFVLLFLLFSSIAKAQIWHDENCFYIDTLDNSIPPVFYTKLIIPAGESRTIEFTNNFTLLGAYSLNYVSWPVTHIEDFTLDLMYDNTTNVVAGIRNADYGCWGGDAAAFPSFENATYKFPFVVVVNCTFSNVSHCNISVAYTFQNCFPQCIGRECGSDSCGQFCGDCTGAAECGIDGLCVYQTESPSHTPEEKSSGFGIAVGVSISAFLAGFITMSMLYIFKYKRQEKQMQMNPLHA